MSAIETKKPDLPTNDRCLANLLLLPLQLVAWELEFADPLSGKPRRCITRRTLSEGPCRDDERTPTVHYPRFRAATACTSATKVPSSSAPLRLYK